MSYGDLETPIMFRPPLVQMSTAITRIYTPDGFVIAADGRSFNTDTNKIVTDSAQKIFEIEQSGRRLAYTLSGTAEITEKTSTVIVFDYASQLRQVVDKLATSKIKSLWHFEKAICDSLATLPENAKRALATYDSPLSPTLVSFDGYYDGRPKSGQVRIFYDGQEPEVQTFEPRRGLPIGCGSEKVLLTLLTNTSMEVLAKHRGPFTEFAYDAVTMSSALDVAQAIIAAQCDPEARTLDPMCIHIGGHIHIAKVTFTDGFRWIVRPSD